MSPVGTTRDERLRMRLALQALSFEMKGKSVTGLERASLGDAVDLTARVPLSPVYQALRAAAIVCLASDPLTDEALSGLRRAVDQHRAPKIVTRQNSARVLKPEPEQSGPRRYWLEGNLA